MELLNVGRDGSGWSEDRLHRWLATLDWPVGLAGSRGHDAAVLDRSDQLAAICTDQCIEGVHVPPDAPGDVVGRKAVLRTLSDLAATAARARAVTLAVRAPAERDEDWLRAAITAAREAAVAHGAELVAGDLAAGPGPASIVVAALGEVDATRAPVGRDRARPGQRVVVTGPLGGSLAGGRQLRPVPRFDAAATLAEAGATAMMDVSDGLALDLFRIARSSNVRIVIQEDHVPIHADADLAAGESGRTALDHALHDGEDHELVATLAGEVPGGCIDLGRVEEGEGLALLGPAGSREWRPDRGGWTHGGAQGDATPG
ncbi:MAG: thiamine-phosphate kinase [Planctomycetota bacterium]